MSHPPKVKPKRPSDFNSRMHAVVEESIQRFEQRQKENKTESGAIR